MNGKVAVITGGASGIGRAIGAELVAHGAVVVLADVNAEAAKLAAEQLTEAGPGRAQAIELDVTDGPAVVEAYRAVRNEHGRLDLAFNNAGIGVGGLAEELTLEHWDRTIDVNLRGVVHGVHAAYPIMLEQRDGHIVNTASLAGLVMPAIMTPYTATKHAVVALSMALRAEGASRGVRVSAVCPSFVETPLLENINPGLPPTRASRQSRSQIRRLQRRLYQPDRLARDVVRGIERNRALIIAPRQARVMAWAARHLPAAARAVSRREVGAYLRDRQNPMSEHPDV
jgi:NAD(P)-dependent dehydrogenase (short-subunit alcohol dehydrogenase family)